MERQKSTEQFDTSDLPSTEDARAHLQAVVAGLTHKSGLSYTDYLAITGIETGGLARSLIKVVYDRGKQRHKQPVKRTLRVKVPGKILTATASGRHGARIIDLSREEAGVFTPFNSVSAIFPEQRPLTSSVHIVTEPGHLLTDAFGDTFANLRQQFSHQDYILADANREVTNPPLELQAFITVSAQLINHCLAPYQ